MSGMIKTITEQIYREMRRDIMLRRLPAGEKITVKMLQERYDVSSSPIREALIHLQEDGLIEYKPNVGMRVVRLTVRDLDELFSLMTELDVISLRFAVASGHTDRLVDELAEIQRQLDAALFDQENWDRLSDDFHLKFYEIAGNSRLSSSAERIRIQFTVFTIAYQKDEGNRRRIFAEHQSILDALRSGDMAMAEALMRRHGNSAHEMALAALKGQSE